jgi:hypothetical protein
MPASGGAKQARRSSEPERNESSAVNEERSWKGRDLRRQRANNSTSVLQSFTSHFLDDPIIQKQLPFHLHFNKLLLFNKGTLKHSTTFCSLGRSTMITAVLMSESYRFSRIVGSFPVLIAHESMRSCRCFPHDLPKTSHPNRPARFFSSRLVSFLYVHCYRVANRIRIVSLFPTKWTLFHLFFPRRPERGSSGLFVSYGTISPRHHVPVVSLLSCCIALVALLLYWWVDRFVLVFRNCCDCSFVDWMVPSWTDWSYGLFPFPRQQTNQQLQPKASTRYSALLVLSLSQVRVCEHQVVMLWILAGSDCTVVYACESLFGCRFGVSLAPKIQIPCLSVTPWTWSWFSESQNISVPRRASMSGNGSPPTS